MSTRQSVIAQAIDRLATGTANIPADIRTQDPLTLADQLQQGSQAGGSRAFAAYKTAQSINAQE